MPYDEDLALIEYIVPIGRLVGPQKILSASKISKKRICVYLDNEKSVDALFQHHANITVNSKMVSLRRLVAPSRRLILSNVQTCIPNQVISEALRNINIKLVSSIHDLHIGLTSDNIDKAELAHYAHVTSFCQGVYIEDDGNTNIPDSLLISFDNESHRIFITHEDQKCHICKSQSHQAASCPEASDDLSFEDKLHEARLKAAKAATMDPETNIATNGTKHISDSQLSELKSQNQSNIPESQIQSEISTNDVITTTLPLTGIEPTIPTTDGRDVPPLLMGEDAQPASNKRNYRRESNSSSSTLDNSISKKPKPDDQHTQPRISCAIQEFCDSQANKHDIDAQDLIEFISELQKTKTNDIDLQPYTENKKKPRNHW